MMTVGDYLTNPYGKGVSSFSVSRVRENVARELEHDYPEPIRYNLYTTKHNDLIFHCKLPSRSKKGVYFDVVFEINISMAAPKSKQGIGHYTFRCFSNSPSFYYTFAQAFRQEGMICTWLWTKYGAKIRNEPSSSRNPANIVGYERTIYTCLWFLHNQLRNRPVLDLYQSALISNHRDLAKLILSEKSLEEGYRAASLADAVIRRKEEQARKREEAKAAREQAKADRAKKSNPHKSETSKTTGKIAKTVSTKKSGTTKSVSKTSTIK